MTSMRPEKDSRGFNEVGVTKVQGLRFRGFEVRLGGVNRVTHKREGGVSNTRGTSGATTPRSPVNVRWTLLFLLPPSSSFLCGPSRPHSM